MELDGLLLDEEGTFSLSGFQDFTVSVPRGTPTGVRCPRPSLCSALCLRRPLGLCCLVLWWACMAVPLAELLRAFPGPSHPEAGLR